MKIIHSADWHIGHRLYGYDRDDEHRAFFNELSTIVIRHKPDALIVAGDIFNTSNPTIASRRLYTEALMSLRQAAPDMRIIISPGNHDSAGRLGVERPLWEVFGVDIASDAADTDSLIFKIGDKGYVVAVPYIFENSYPATEAQDDLDGRMKAYHQALLDEVARRNYEGLPVVMSAHLAVAKADVVGQFDSPLSFHPIENMGHGYDYLALGHIHKAQQFNAGISAVARYAGSPFAMSFDELREHSVTVVDIDGHNCEPVITIEPVTPSRPLVNYNIDNPLSLDKTIESLHELENNDDIYLRAYVSFDHRIDGDAKMRLAESVRNKKARFCCIQPVFRHKPDIGEISSLISRDNLEVKSPLEIANDFYTAIYGVDMPADMAEIMREARLNVLKKQSEADSEQNIAQE